MAFQYTLNAPQSLRQQVVGRAVATRLADSSYLGEFPAPALDISHQEN